MASVRLRIPSDPPVSSARVQLLGSLHRRSPHAIGRARATRPRPSSIPLSHRSGQRRTTRGMHVCCRPSTDTCVFYFDPAASNALPIYKSPTSRIESHCHTKIRGTKPGRTIGMRKQEQRRRQCSRAKEPVRDYRAVCSISTFRLPYARPPPLPLVSRGGPKQKITCILPLLTAPTPYSLCTMKCCCCPETNRI